MNYALMILTSLLGAHLTYFLSHRGKMGPIRASALSTLFFLACTFLAPFAIIPRLQAAFFGATFVGMSDASRLSEKRVLFASAIFGVFFCFLSQFKGGIGGTLGAAAFASSVLAYALY